METYSTEFLARRGISKETHEFFGAITSVDTNGKPHHVTYPYPNGASKLRFLDTKAFVARGPMSEASGWAMDRFAGGQARAITITEGEDDAMAVFQMLGGYPVYSVRSANFALKDCSTDFEYLNSFSKIYLCLDSDSPGQDATSKVAALFPFSKVYHVKLNPYKDAHEFLEAGKGAEFKSVWFNSSRFLPEGVTSSFSAIKAVLDKASREPGIPWPYSALTHLTDGIKLGKSYLLSGLEGIGKTEFFHAVEYNIAKLYPDVPIGILHYEQPLDENIRKMVGYELRQPCHLSDSNISNEEVLKTFEKIAVSEDRIHFHNRFGTEDPDDVLTIIRFLVAACGCKYVFFDNITVTATGRVSDKSVAELDYLSTRLEMLVKELHFALIFISHENANQETRGSKNISKVCDVWINMTRNVRDENEHTRNIQYLTLFKNRGGRGTGPAGRLYYDEATGILSELTDELPA